MPEASRDFERMLRTLTRWYLSFLSLHPLDLADDALLDTAPSWMQLVKAWSRRVVERAAFEEVDGRSRGDLRSASVLAKRSLESGLTSGSAARRDRWSPAAGLRFARPGPPFPAPSWAR